MIEVKNLSKTFKVAKRSAGIYQAAKSLFKRNYTLINALKDISFSIEEGEIAGYIGPNGAGKSTTIKIMSGILVPDKGECRIMGRVPWKERTAHVRNIGVVFGQRSQLWWDVPVIDSFELLRDIYKVDINEYKKNFDMLVEILEISKIIDTPVRQLSLGQRMRCEIAASLLHNPKILFLDEPTIGLDAVSKIAVRKFIRKINEENKVTVILTTHDMNDIEKLADRIILIGKGEILFDGSLVTLTKKYITYKTLTVDYVQSEKKADIEGTKIISRSDERAVLSVDLDKVTVASVISKLTSIYNIIDISVDSEPIEEIIAQIYREYDI